MARWCDGGRTQRSRLGTLTDKAVKTAKRRAAEATLGKVQIENNVLDNVYSFEYLGTEPGRSTLNVLNYKYKYFPPRKYLSTSTFLFG